MTIQELRKTFHLSQSALAKRLGISPSTVSQIETSRMQISDTLANKIWSEFGVDVSHESKPKRVKTKASKLDIYIQSPMGGDITPEQVAAKMPEGAEACYVRVDQNLIWWIRGNETGAVRIWD